MPFLATEKSIKQDPKTREVQYVSMNLDIMEALTKTMEERGGDSYVHRKGGKGRRRSRRKHTTLRLPDISVPLQKKISPYHNQSCVSTSKS